MSSLLSNLILDVGDMERSLSFYRDLLGLEVSREDRWDGHRLVFLQAGAAEMLLLQQPVGEQELRFPRSGGMMIKFSVEDLPRLEGLITREGLQVLRPLEAAPFGERSLLVADPDGYAVLLAEQMPTF
jgi:predicted enzyme related to lactoylglutathione lyase